MPLINSVGIMEFVGEDGKKVPISPSFRYLFTTFDSPDGLSGIEKGTRFVKEREREREKKKLRKRNLAVAQ